MKLGKKIKISNQFFSVPNFMEKLLTGGMAEPASVADGYFTKIARSTLATFQNCDNCTVANTCCTPQGVGTTQAGAISDGFDLLAWNIQRGRDQGVACKSFLLSSDLS